MLKRHSQVLVSTLLCCDAVVACMSWVGAYYLRFHTPLNIFGHSHVPESVSYFFLLVFIVPASLIANKGSKLYQPKRIVSFGKEFAGIVRATIITLMIFLAVVFFVRTEQDNRFSRTFIVIFSLLHISLMVLERFIIRSILRKIRSQGKNLRRALIIGAGKNGQALASAVHRNTWAGIEIKGYLDDRPERQELIIRNIPVLGLTASILDIIQDKNIDQVYIALPADQQQHAFEIVEQLSEETVDVFIVPDVLSMASLKLDISNFEGLPIINLRESPVFGWNMITKRSFDIVFSLAALILCSLPMLCIALLIKLTSKGPVLYKQERMGLDGQTFSMLKFRSMKTDAEVESGAVWAKENDPRRTRLGTFLRKTSLDELPQFFNVLRGNMSVVGPRPERPVFIKEFKKTVPKYMLRHKMKAGITGWAQINGWRGDTSLKKRIQFDLYYIENWSVTFDMYIIFLTVFRIFKQQNAY